MAVTAYTPSSRRRTMGYLPADDTSRTTQRPTPAGWTSALNDVAKAVGTSPTVGSTRATAAATPQNMSAQAIAASAAPRPAAGGPNLAGRATAAMGGDVGTRNPGYNDAAQGQFDWQGDPWTGFASRYAPAYADILLSNPQQIFLNQLQGMGLAPTGVTGDYGSLRTLEPYADIMPVLYTMMNMDRDNALSPEAQTNYIANFARNMMTPGGSAPSTQGLLSQVFGDPTFAQMFLRGGNPVENVNATNDMVNAIAGLGFNPFLAGGLANLIDQGGTQYLSGVTQGQNLGSYDQWLAQRYGNMVPFLTGGR